MNNLKLTTMNESNLIDLSGGRSLDTVQDEDIDQTLYMLDNMAVMPSGYSYMLDSEAIELFFSFWSTNAIQSN
jgi:hypothetical protein